MKSIAKREAMDTLDSTMSDPCPANWNKAETVFVALKAMFPTCMETITRMRAPFSRDGT